MPSLALQGTFADETPITPRLRQLKAIDHTWVSGSDFVTPAALVEWLDHLATEQQATQDVAFSGATAEPPTASEPLRGLRHLGPLALRGAAQIRKLAAEPINWAWKDYVVPGTVVVLAGPSSEGKTTLAFLILMARATLGPPIALCGREVKPAAVGRYVVVVEAEHGESSTARKLVKSAELLGLGDDALERVISISRKAVMLGSPEWKDIESMIAAGIVADVAIDTWARVTTGDSNKEEDQARNFEIIAGAIEKAPPDAQPNMWLLLHTRKGKADSLDDVAGSVQRVAQADTVLLVNADRDENGKVQSTTVKLVKAREEPDDYPEASKHAILDGRIEWSSGGSKGGTGPMPEGITALGKKILVFLRGQQELRAVTYIAKAVKRSTNDVSNELQELSEAGHVREVIDGVQHRGNAYDGWETARPTQTLTPTNLNPDVLVDVTQTSASPDVETSMNTAA
jgi:hypothetical protein